MSQAAEALRREIEALYSSGADPARLRELQKRYRSLGVLETRHLDPDGKCERITHGNPADGVTRMGPIVARGGAMLGTAAAIREATSPNGGTALLSGGPVTAVMLDRRARDDIARHGFDGLEAGFGLWGVVHAGGVVQIMYAQDVSEERAPSSMRLSRERLADWDARLAHTGAELLGDAHSHPRSYGRVANPSDADLNWWRAQLQRSGRSFYLGLLVQRKVDDDTSWLYPTMTAFSLWKDDAGATQCDVLDVEIEPES